MAAQRKNSGNAFPLKTTALAAVAVALVQGCAQTPPQQQQAPVESQFLKVAAGRVCGIVQDGVGFVAGEPRIVLHMEASLGAPETYDSVQVEGLPRLHVKALGGYHGDVATASITVNTIPKVLGAAPGLHTMRSLALPSFAGGK